MAGILLSKTDHERLKRMLRDYETNGKRPQYRRRTVSVGGGGGGKWYLAKIVSTTSRAGGYYNCQVCTLAAATWDTNSVDPFAGAGDSVIVCNQAEVPGTTHALSAGEFLVCGQITDDGGTARYVGCSPKYFWWHA